MTQKQILLTIEYDGTGFSGWQRQPDKRTVQGTLEKALSDLMGRPVTVNGVSRTDAGVHALGQRAVFQGDVRIPAERIPSVLNRMFRGRSVKTSADADIRITEAREVPLTFGIRKDSRGKEYRYLIRDGGYFDVFERNRVYSVRETLDTGLMRRAARYITGTHDFTSFRASGAEPDVSTVKTVYSLDIDEKQDEKGRLIVIDIQGSGFLYNMVRIIAGTLVEVGAGRTEPDKVKDIIDGKDRTLAGHTAPPQGLYLVEVFYDEKAFEMPDPPEKKVEI
jgi:tRNA pseudouridine38-40 synthase